MNTRTVWTLVGTAAVLAALASRRAQQAAAPQVVGPSGVVESSTTPRRGRPADRGKMAAYALDIDRLRTRDDLQPVVQYLTFIQSQRGDDDHMLFVRYEDIDAMAALEGDPVPRFLERLDQLGVVVSNN